MFLESRIFRMWLIAMGVIWLFLFWQMVDLPFLLSHWHYPATMVLGAFVAGSTPEGGGAVAFPVLSIFFKIDREVARDFSLMIQSVGMTSASVYILTHPSTDRAAFRPLLGFMPVALVGFLLGMWLLQDLNVVIIQALFLALITSFSVAYLRGGLRGTEDRWRQAGVRDLAETGFALLLGGMCASLFGTGLDILVYTVLVTRFRMQEKLATQMSIIMMAAMSLLGFAFRGLVQQDLQPDQFRTWLTAFPVVLIMAPLGALVLRRVNREVLLWGVVILNIAQLAYFNLFRPTLEKTVSSLGFTLILLAFFAWVIWDMRRRLPQDDPAQSSA